MAFREFLYLLCKNNKSIQLLLTLVETNQTPFKNFNFKFF